MDKFVDCLKFIWSKTNRFHRVILVFLVIEIQPFPGRKYGFHCNDPALSYPFNGDTITWKWLMAVCCLLPLAVMLTVERIYYKDKEQSNARALRWHKEYLFGYALNLCIVQIVKYLVGSPRPHFFDTCMPHEATTCTGSEFVSSYTCSKAKQWQYQSDQSFPSGHTSLALHAGFFTIYYLHRRLSPPERTAAVRAVQLLSGACAVWCAVSRMTDHRHHWWDVLGGTAIGIAVLIYTIHHQCKNFECSIKSGPPTTSNGESNAPLVEAES